MSNLFKGFTAVFAVLLLTTMLLPIEAISLTDEESLDLAQEDKKLAIQQLEKDQAQANKDQDELNQNNAVEAEKLKNLRQAQSPPQ